ncbi:hypothetical protein BD779DRAFT_1479970, partial [Infundibulicybe gibba]
MQKRTKRRVQLRRPAAAVVPVTPADDRAYIRNRRKREEAATAPRGMATEKLLNIQYSQVSAVDCICDETIGTKELLYHAHAHFGHRGPPIQGGDEFLKHQLGNLIQAKACHECTRGGEEEKVMLRGKFPTELHDHETHLTLFYEPNTMRMTRKGSARREDDEYTFWGRLFPLWFEHFPEHLTGRFLISDKITLYLAMKMREKLIRDDMNLMNGSLESFSGVRKVPIGHDWQGEMELEWKNEVAKPKANRTLEEWLP